FYLTPNGTVTSVSFDTDRGVEIGPPKVLFQVPGAEVDWAVTRNGERFLLAAPARHTTPSPFTVVFICQEAVNKYPRGLSPKLSLRAPKTGPPEPTATKTVDRGSD